MPRLIHVIDKRRHSGSRNHINLDSVQFKPRERNVFTIEKFMKMSSSEKSDLIKMVGELV